VTPLDLQASVSDHLQARTRDLVEGGDVTILCVNGLDARQWSTYREVGVDLGPVRHARGTVGEHRVELDLDRGGGWCDCSAGRHDRLCSHLLALLAVAGASAEPATEGDELARRARRALALAEKYTMTDPTPDTYRRGGR
jgi:hypothetical protein